MRLVEATWRRQYDQATEAVQPYLIHIEGGWYVGPECPAAILRVYESLQFAGLRCLWLVP